MSNASTPILVGVPSPVSEILLPSKTACTVITRASVVTSHQYSNSKQKGTTTYIRYVYRYNSVEIFSSETDNHKKFLIIIAIKKTDWVYKNHK